MSPIHINYINEGMNGCEASGYNDWRAMAIRNVTKNHQPSQRNSFILPFDYLEEGDEGNFIIPDPVYCDNAFNLSCEKFKDVIDTPGTSMMSINTNEQSTRKRRKRYRDHRRSQHSIENETLLLQDIVPDVSKGARPKVYYGRRKHHDSIGKELTNIIIFKILI